MHTLGNLTLTRYNSRYSDRHFAEKRDIEDGFKHSPLYLNIGLGQCEKWDEAAIHARADRLADLAVQVWQAPSLPEEVLAVYRGQPENKTSYSLSDYPFLLMVRIAGCYSIIFAMKLCAWTQGSRRKY